MTRKCGCLIVGSGAGGATLARELAKAGKDVLVLESGSSEFPMPLTIEKSVEGTEVFAAYGRGGATVLANANGVRCLEKELAAYGISLDREFAELEVELKIAPIHESLLSPEGTPRILERCKAAGIPMRRMPKFIDHTKCKCCTLCSHGCRQGAKWTALEFLKEAAEHGATIVHDTRVERVLIENGKAVGVEARKGDVGARYDADVVILAAGGLKTPVILQNSGFAKAGKGLFIDACEMWFGVTPEIDISDEPSMQLVHTACAASHGFILSTGHVKAADKLQYYLKEKADEYRRSNWVAVIVKISDESAGCVHPDGTFAKPMTASDRRKLDAGGRAAKEFLLAIGAREDSIVKREGIYGGHNGASAAIGTVVDANLATEADGLFICDSSVLPTAPGMPPILTILALAKRLGRALT